MSDTREYVAPPRFRWLTRFYDPVLAAVLLEKRLRRVLIAQAAVEPGQRVLDLGCGTGSLLALLKAELPAGFSRVTETRREKTALGTISFYRGVKPQADPGVKWQATGPTVRPRAARRSACGKPLAGQS